MCIWCMRLCAIEHICILLSNNLRHTALRCSLCHKPIHPWMCHWYNGSSAGHLSFTFSLPACHLGYGWDSWVLAASPQFGACHFSRSNEIRNLNAATSRVEFRMTVNLFLAKHPLRTQMSGYSKVFGCQIRKENKENQETWAHVAVLGLASDNSPTLWKKSLAVHCSEGWQLRYTRLSAQG